MRAPMVPAPRTATLSILLSMGALTTPALEARSYSTIRAQLKLYRYRILSSSERLLKHKKKWFDMNLDWTRRPTFRTNLLFAWQLQMAKHKSGARRKMWGEDGNGARLLS